MLRLLLIVVALTTAAYGDPISKPTNRIIDGAPLSKTKYYEVAIVSESTDGGLVRVCTGALVGSRWVLTSAFCAKTRGTLTVQYGTDTISLTGDDAYYIRKTYVHPYYSEANPTNYNIALLEIYPIVQSTGVQIIKLASVATANFYLGKVGVVSGWGATGKFDEYSDALLYKNVIIIDNNYCRLTGPINNCMICTEGNSVCEGDQGAPLVFGDEVIGVANPNLDARNCDTITRTTFTRVDSYLPWLNYIMNQF